LLVVLYVLLVTSMKYRGFGLLVNPRKAYNPTKAPIPKAKKAFFLFSYFAQQEARRELRLQRTGQQEHRGARHIM
jgi:hypothetical protein